MPGCENDTAGDIAAAADVSAPRLIGNGYRSYHRYLITFNKGAAFARIERDILRSGKVVGILPVDLARNEVVLVRQFRLGSHMALGKGAMVELPAGRVDAHETFEQAARRECYEETGVYPSQLQALFDIMPAPALSDECMRSYVACVDATKINKRSGDREEDIENIRIPIEIAVEMGSRGELHNSVVIIALQWLALNLHRLPQILRERPLSPA